ncbi:PREDICTED: deSI-like protein At4g17486 isoform X1 [Nicotiana attenuata]|uniref:Desi-like protein n=1 Tax=Nicotiana attenuata TaxID=49451 RepID=A0A1J6KEH7_NICAT|nr:PREDICTED: deSI-like protein At4g17486 isoform X1 [Nicotiana attenuata]OIT27108.1 desi-like protein [Nicotiana attenuata]
MPCCKNSVKCGRGSVPVYLNVYDLTSMNGYAYWLGLGVYHSGVQVHGVEYAFGAHEYPTTGIFEGEPKKCEGFIFRKTLLIGWTEKTPGEVRGVMEELADKYKGIAYNLITKNCNHFCNDACIKLTSNPIPSWVNRLARIGFFCHCIIPMNLKSTKVRHHRMEDKVSEGDSKKPQSSSNRQTPTSNPSPASAQSPPIAKSTSNKSKSPLPPSSPLISDSTSSSQSPPIAKSTSNKGTRPQPPSSLISESNSS